jgi:hypothetical protein
MPGESYPALGPTAESQFGNLGFGAIRVLPKLQAFWPNDQIDPRYEV